MSTDTAEIIRLTEEYGGSWGVNHSRRILKLIAIIGEGLVYNSEAVWLAAHLHDWGGYSPWAQKGINHAIRSRQVAETFLRERGYSQQMIELVSECLVCSNKTDLLPCLPHDFYP